MAPNGQSEDNNRTAYIFKNVETRKTRTRLTFTAKHLQNQDSGKVTRKLVDRKIKKSSYYNRGAREMSKLHEEDTVRIRPFGVQ